MTDGAHRIVVFVGPTLVASEVRQRIPAAEIRGPASCGDLYLAAQRGPGAIALIDGHFDHALSVWHKEILWALSRGVAVYGAASLGALRAAELADFGMIGVGDIFEAFLDGTLEDDDEVAVIHGPAEAGYPARSEAMVNLRATVRRAQSEGTITDASAAAFLRSAKAAFYPDRSYPALWLEATRRGAPSLDEVERFRRWIEAGGRVDQKRADALALVDRLAQDHVPYDDRPPTRRAPAVPHFTFAYTAAWHGFTQELQRRRPP